MEIMGICSGYRCRLYAGKVLVIVGTDIMFYEVLKMNEYLNIDEDKLTSLYEDLLKKMVDEMKR